MIEKAFVAALEPIAEAQAELELRVQKIERAQEVPINYQVPIDDVTAALKKDDEFLDSVRGQDGLHGAEGDRGEKGDKGEKGDPGMAGIGVNVLAWAPGIYRKDAIVQHDLGCISIALKDTNDKPGDSPDWGRVGSGGFRWCGLLQEGREYRDGDLFVDSDTTFLWLNEKAHILARRGRKGIDGKNGRDGKDAAQLFKVAILDDDKTLALVMSDGAVIECALPPGFAFVAKAQQAVAELAEQVAAMKADLDELRQSILKRKGAAHG